MVSKFRLHAQYDKNCFPDLNFNGIRKSGWLRPKLHLDFHARTYTSSQILLRWGSLGQTKIIEKYINPKCDFKIVWVQCDLQDSDSQLTDFLDCYVFKTIKERYLFTSLLQGEIQNSIFFLQKFPSITPKSLNGKLLQLPYNIITTCLVCERVRKKERQIFNHELHKRKVGKWY